MIFFIILILLLTSGPAFPAPLNEEKSLLLPFNPFKWFSNLFPKKENPLKLKLNVPPPPPPSILFQSQPNINPNVEREVSSSGESVKEKTPFSGEELPQTKSQPKEPQQSSSPWRWY